MKIPEKLPTEREAVNLHRLTPHNTGAYLRSFIANRYHIGRFSTPMRSVDEKPVVARRQLSREFITSLIGDEVLHMGIWDQSAFVGSVSLAPESKQTAAEVGYWVEEQRTGKGYASLAVRAISEYGKTQFPVVYARIAENNWPSLGVVERTGYTQIARQAGVLVFEYGEPTGFIPPAPGE